jgi:soluble lytic murein transglycosylase
MRRCSRFAPAAGVAVALALVLCAQGPLAGQGPDAGQGPAAGSQGQAAVEPNPQLLPTVHAPVPENVDDFWFAPRPAAIAGAGTTALAAAAAAYAAGNHPAVLTSARQAVPAGGPLEPYARFYIGLAELRLSHAAEADKAFDQVLARKPDGYLSAAAMMGKAEAAELRGDQAAAADLYEKLSSHKSVAPEDVLLRLGRASLASGDRKRAAEAFQRVYYEFPLTEAASNARDALGSLQDFFVRNTPRDLGRALILFGAKRYGEARSEFQDLQRKVTGDDGEVVDLRLAECDYFLKRYAAARDGLQPYLEQASRKAEARFFYLSALRGLGAQEQAAALTRALVADFPDSSWAGEALNNLGTHYIVTDQDDLAAQTFKELFDRFPNGPNAERAAWKYGWWAYTNGNYAETARVFEKGSAVFPRSDYRPPWLYWAARSREKMGDRDAYQARMRLVYTDYMNSYYGRLASRRLPAPRAEAAAGTAGYVQAVSLRAAPPVPLPDLPPTAALIRQLLAAGLYDDGLNELRFAQKAWGTTPAIEATIAWVYHQKGDLRRAITVMRRAYPQFLAAGGEGLPKEILQVIFPLTYWEAIKENSAIHDLDPYLVAALIAQESTFDAGVRSVANAWGLMQLLPSTGRQLARSQGIPRFTTSMLTNGETNIRLGTLYFKRLIQKFGGTYYALASYNAGDSRVARWKAERPGMDEDEFIDDIPFAETQNYVKRILGTAEDYRRLYGDRAAQPRPAVKPAVAKKPTVAAKKKTPPKKAPPKKRTPVKKKR